MNSHFLAVDMINWHFLESDSDSGSLLGGCHSQALEGFSLLLPAQQCDCGGIRKDLSPLNLVVQKEILEVAAALCRFLENRNDR